MTATLSPAQEVPITLTFAPNADVYTLKSGGVDKSTITIAAGSTSGTLTVTAVNNEVDDTDASVTQTPTTGPNWVSITGATLTIKDDDLPKPHRPQGLRPGREGPAGLDRGRGRHGLHRPVWHGFHLRHQDRRHRHYQHLEEDHRLHQRHDLLLPRHRHRYGLRKFPSPPTW